MILTDVEAFTWFGDKADILAIRTQSEKVHLLIGKIIDIVDAATG